jgi:hypothetical protein
MLLSVVPAIETFTWTGRNDFFIASCDKWLAFGGGGDFALWFDDELHHGASHASATFSNTSCVSSAPDFKVIALEVWGFSVS